MDMKKGKFWFYVFDADVAKHEGDWLGMATLPYDADAGVHVLTLNKGKADGAKVKPTLEITLQSQPAPPPPPSADPPAPPSPPPLVKQVCIMDAVDMPPDYDAVDDTGGLPRTWIDRRGLPENNPFEKAPRPPPTSSSNCALENCCRSPSPQQSPPSPRHHRSPSRGC